MCASWGLGDGNVCGMGCWERERGCDTGYLDRKRCDMVCRGPEWVRQGLLWTGMGAARGVGTGSLRHGELRTEWVRHGELGTGKGAVWGIVEGNGCDMVCLDGNGGTRRVGALSDGVRCIPGMSQLRYYAVRVSPADILHATFGSPSQRRREAVWHEILRGIGGALCGD